MTRRNLLRQASLALPVAALAPADTFGADRLPPPPLTSAKACVVVDAVTGASLFEKEPDARRAVASTQKLLSALVALEKMPIEQTLNVAQSDTTAEPHKLYMKAGEQYPFRILLHAMLIESCNDVARCVARNCAGSEDEFAELMNRRAASLGMKNSRFKNASGLPAEGQFSTARDMSRVALAAIRHPVIRGIVCLGEYNLQRPDGRVKKLQTTNHLLRRNASTFMPICTGMKTGFTNAAGKCLISSATHRGRTIIVVMLGSSSKVIWRESRNLLNWGLGLTA